MRDSVGRRRGAVGMYVRFDCCAADVMRELGYPASRGSLATWYREWLAGRRGDGVWSRGEHGGRYAAERKQAAVDFSVSHGRSLRRTIRHTGYPSHEVPAARIDEPVPSERRIRIHSDRGCHCRWPEWIRICREHGPARFHEREGLQSEQRRGRGLPRPPETGALPQTRLHRSDDRRVHGITRRPPRPASGREDQNPIRHGHHRQTPRARPHGIMQEHNKVSNNSSPPPTVHQDLTKDSHDHAQSQSESQAEPDSQPYAVSQWPRCVTPGNRSACGIRPCPFRGEVRWAWRPRLAPSPTAARARAGRGSA